MDQEGKQSIWNREYYYYSHTNYNQGVCNNIILYKNNILPPDSLLLEKRKLQKSYPLKIFNFLILFFSTIFVYGIKFHWRKFEHNCHPVDLSYWSECYIRNFLIVTFVTTNATSKPVWHNLLCWPIKNMNYIFSCQKFGNYFSWPFMCIGQYIIKLCALWSQMIN